MPGLLENSPYAGFNPANDPYLRSIPKQKNLNTGNDFYKGLLAGPVGMVGDIEPFFSPFGVARQAVDRALPNAGVPQQMFPTSEQVGGLLGANTQTQDFNVGLLGAPDLTDVSRMSAGLLGHTLFHGTPHKFDKFDLKAIGSGEGAQAYGHGLYFAESPGVAGSYRDALAKQTAFGPKKASEAEWKVQGWLADPDNADVPDELIDKFDELLQVDGTNNPDEWDAIYDHLVNESGGFELGHLYEVDIPDEVTAKMLDWDAPLSEQPESVRKALTDLGETRSGRGPIRGEYGHSIYANLSAELGSDEAVSLALNEAGIPGIRFLDGSSRGAGEGTRNIVVFNPDDITQVKRDSELVYKAK